MDPRERINERPLSSVSQFERWTVTPLARKARLRIGTWMPATAARTSELGQVRRSCTYPKVSAAPQQADHSLRYMHRLFSAIREDLNKGAGVRSRPLKL